MIRATGEPGPLNVFLCWKLFWGQVRRWRHSLSPLFRREIREFAKRGGGADAAIFVMSDIQLGATTPVPRGERGVGEGVDAPVGHRSGTGQAPVGHRSGTGRAPVRHRSGTGQAPVGPLLRHRSGTFHRSGTGWATRPRRQKPTANFSRVGNKRLTAHRRDWKHLSPCSRRGAECPQSSQSAVCVAFAVDVRLVDGYCSALQIMGKETGPQKTGA